MGRGRSIAAAIAVAIGAILYGISPIDVIPELLTGPLGFADDIAVWLGAGFAIWKLLTGSKPGPDNVSPPTAPPSTP